jgi:threonylcarbamoyladenosine tRNA methylthiotransferase MtaB
LKISFHTLGCKLNFAETSDIANRFRAGGHKITGRREGADILVINTCAVTDVAEKKCRTAIRQARKSNPEAIVVVIGCFSQLSPEEIASMEEVDIVVGNEHKHQLPEILHHYKHGDHVIIDNTNILKTRVFTPGYSLIDRTRTFLKIQDGCNYGCTYCTIPKARGRSRSGKTSEILQSISELDQQGVREIVLTGVNIGDFGRPHHESLLQLLEGINLLSPVTRIRIGSVEPELLSDELIRLVAGTPCLMPHFHLPLQSGSDQILAAMKRKYNTHLFRQRIETIMKYLPDACIAADVIAGFPGETGEHFMETFHFIEELPLSYVHVFTYSERKDTPAQTILPKVPTQVKKHRTRILHDLSDAKKSLFYTRFIHSERLVLFESENTEGFIKGFTDNYIRVKHPWNESYMNQIIRVKVGMPEGNELVCHSIDYKV